MFIFELICLKKSLRISLPVTVAVAVLLFLFPYEFGIALAPLIHRRRDSVENDLKPFAAGSTSP